MKKTKGAQHYRFSNTRKAIRKHKRQEKKVHRQEHYMKKKIVKDLPKSEPGKFVKRPADPPEPGPDTKKKKQKQQPLSQEIINKERQKEQKEVQRLNSQMEKQRKKMLVQANEEEDRMIKKLEKQLGLNKSKNKNNYFADDGLDYLLDICDRATSEQIVAAEKHLADVEDESDFEDDLAMVTGKEVEKEKKEPKGVKKKHEDSQSDDDVSEEMNGEEMDSESDIGESNEELESEDESSGLEDEDDDKEMSDFGDDESDDQPEEQPTKSKKSNVKIKELETKTKKTEPKKNVKDKTKKDEKKLVKDRKEKIIKAEDLSKVFSDDEVSHLSGDDDDDDLEGMPGEEFEKESAEALDKKSKEKPDVWEDIYGRKRDKEGNVIKEEKGTYIPPHLRNKDSNADKDQILLKRQIKSILNKLSGTNLHWACTSIENLYGQNSRHAVSSALTELWLAALVQVSAATDRLVAEHAALQAVLHANVAAECGAHLLQELTQRFDELMLTPQPVEDKRLDNIVSCLSHLYSFKIFHANLLYDILGRLTDSLCEKHIECILVCLRVVGGVLRKEEPMALRGYIHTVQTKAGDQQAREGSRLKFLLEVLMAVKNNNLMKIPNYDPSYTEHLKKTIRGIIRKGNYITPLNIRLEDLLKAEERGKWWIVGSAWEGNRPQEERTADRAADCGPPADRRLLALARQQRMNTDIRRTVFCVIMAAEDYMSAFEKLEQLGLRGPQQREIAHVVLACSLQEKTYNPYYAVLATKLADSDRKYQLSFQFSIWDKIKDIDSLSKLSMANLAQFLVHLIMEKALPLSVLKIIQFSDLTKRTVKFMRQVLLSIIMNENLESTLEVFHRIAKPPKLHIFRESLRLFIQHFLIKNTAKKNNVLSEKEMQILRERASEVEKILSMHEKKLMF